MSTPKGNSAACSRVKCSKRLRAPALAGALSHQNLELAELVAAELVPAELISSKLVPAELVTTAAPLDSTTAPLNTELAHFIASK